MDFQYLFNGLAVAFGGLMGWLLKTLWAAVESLRKDVRELESVASERYVRRDDWQIAVDRIETKLDKLFERLDQKADR